MPFVTYVREMVETFTGEITEAQTTLSEEALMDLLLRDPDGFRKSDLDEHFDPDDVVVTTRWMLEEVSDDQDVSIRKFEGVEELHLIDRLYNLLADKYEAGLSDNESELYQVLGNVANDLGMEPCSECGAFIPIGDVGVCEEHRG